MTTDSYSDRVEQWRATRLARLTAEDGWLNIVGRWELEPGSVTFGSAADNDIVVPVGPGHVGTLTLGQGGDVTFAPADGGDAVRLAPDGRTPARFTAGRLLAEVTMLGGVRALRVRDKESPARTSLAEIPHFPVDPSWRIVAEWLPLDEPETMTVDTVAGIPDEVSVARKAAFVHDGVRYELLATHGTPQAPQFVLRDRTAGETYPASRFVFGEEVGEDTIVLDFNKAINPPCAFSDFTTCPLPPPQNVLPFRIEAGELKPAG